MTATVSTRYAVTVDRRGVSMDRGRVSMHCRTVAASRGLSSRVRVDCRRDTADSKRKTVDRTRYGAESLHGVRIRTPRTVHGVASTAVRHPARFVGIAGRPRGDADVVRVCVHPDFQRRV